MADINVGEITEGLNHKVDLPLGKAQDGIDYVISWQVPTAENGRKWFRLYKSGWVEQGGLISGSGVQTINLSIEMATTDYSVLTSVYKPNYTSSASAITILVTTLTTSQLKVNKSYGTGGYAGEAGLYEVKGQADISKLPIFNAQEA